MDCEKVTQTSAGVFEFKKCPCIACKIKKQESIDFWKRFDLIYKQFKGRN